MTTEHDDAADIAWLRNLAEEGSRAPMRGASVMVAAGLIYGSASLVHWACYVGWVPGGLSMAGTVWLSATALFLVALVALIWRRRTAGGVRTAANRAMAAVWAGVGFGIFALFAAILVNDLRIPSHQGTVVFSLVPSIIMVFYGVGWAVTATMARSTPLWLLAAASFLAAPLLAGLSGTGGQYLAYAACLFVLMAVPGWLLMGKARAASGIA